MRRDGKGGRRELESKREGNSDRDRREIEKCRER